MENDFIIVEFYSHTVTVKLMPGKPNLKGRLCTVDLFVPTI
jgi:hypothetical protein